MGAVLYQSLPLLHFSRIIFTRAKFKRRDSLGMRLLDIQLIRNDTSNKQTLYYYNKTVYKTKVVLSEALRLLVVLHLVVAKWIRDIELTNQMTLFLLQVKFRV